MKIVCVAKYQQSVIIHFQNQLTQNFHEQKSKSNAQEKENEERWREWMAGLDERNRRRREGQARQGTWRRVGRPRGGLRSVVSHKSDFGNQ